MPKAVFGSISPDKIPAETNLKPIGSGPFLLDKYDQTQVNLKRNDNYWGKTAFGTPPMTTINHPIFKSNNDGDLKLESGEIDASQQFTAQIWKMWEAGKPVSTWMKKKPYHLPGQPAAADLQPEQDRAWTTPKVRLAIAYGIDYPNIATTAMSDYSEPANASLIVPTGYESKFYDAAAVAAGGLEVRPGQGGRDPGGRAEGQEGLRRHLRAAGRHQARRLEVDHPDRVDRLEHRLRDRRQVGQGDRHRHQHRVPAVPRRCSPGCRTATSISRCTPTPASTRPARGFASATHWTTGECRLPARPRSGTTTGSRTPRSPALLDAAAGGQVRRRGQDGVRRPGQDLSRERACRAADVPPAGVLRVQREQLGELPDRGEPVRSADVAGCRHPVAVQDQEDWNLDTSTYLTQRSEGGTMALAKYSAARWPGPSWSSSWPCC